jgi:hypothetical protein
MHGMMKHWLARHERLSLQQRHTAAGNELDRLQALERAGTATAEERRFAAELGQEFKSLDVQLRCAQAEGVRLAGKAGVK